jgi:hypothetical protein
MDTLAKWSLLGDEESGREVEFSPISLGQISLLFRS